MRELREDFDYVIFANYEGDMRENADRAIAVIVGLRKEIETLHRIMAELIMAAGGRISVPRGVIEQRHRLINVTESPEDKDDSLLFTARWAEAEFKRGRT